MDTNFTTPLQAQPPENQPEQNANFIYKKPGSSLPASTIIGLTVIVVVLALVGLYYYWNSTSVEPEETATTAVLQPQGAVDDIASIETDLSATVIDSLDADLGQVDQELK